MCLGGSKSNNATTPVTYNKTDYEYDASLSTSTGAGRDPAPKKKTQTDSTAPNYQRSGLTVPGGT